jgi:hypothetical protein
MYVASKSREGEIYLRLKHLRKIKAKTWARLFSASIHNDLTDFNNKTKWKKLVYKLNKLASSSNNISYNDIYKETTLLLKIPFYKISKINIVKNTWVNQIHKVILGVENNKKYDRATISVLQNLTLIKNSLPPILHFSFSKWHDVSKRLDKENILDLFEFSIHYLTKLIPIDVRSDNTLLQIGEGAYNKVFYSSKKKEVYKIPVNLAARLYVNHQEYLINKLLLKTGLSQFLPQEVKFIKSNSSIIRKRIYGKSGHQLLSSNFYDSVPKAKEDLKQFFRIYKELTKTVNFRLDIHPGNFVWSNEAQTWTFMDLGPIPSIGSDYFPLSSFKTYFKKVWLDRLYLMKHVPIRSVDIINPPPINHKQ